MAHGLAFSPLGPSPKVKAGDSFGNEEREPGESRGCKLRNNLLVLSRE